RRPSPPAVRQGTEGDAAQGAANQEYAEEDVPVILDVGRPRTRRQDVLQKLLAREVEDLPLVNVEHPPRRREHEHQPLIARDPAIPGGRFGIRHGRFHASASVKGVPARRAPPIPEPSRTSARTSSRPRRSPPARPRSRRRARTARTGPPTRTPRRRPAGSAP